MIMGNQAYGLPLKRAEDILVRRQDDRAYLRVTRRGSVIFEIEAGIGTYDDAERAAQYLGAETGDSEETLDTWSFKYRAQQQPDGTTPFTDVRLVDVTEKVTRETVEPASILGVAARTTPDDPWGLLAMAQPIGAAYERIATRQIVSAKVVDTVDSTENMPYLMAGRFDRGLMTKFVDREFNL